MREVLRWWHFFIFILMADLEIKQRIKAYILNHPEVLDYNGTEPIDPEFLADVVERTGAPRSRVVDLLRRFRANRDNE